MDSSQQDGRGSVVNGFRRFPEVSLWPTKICFSPSVTWARSKGHPSKLRRRVGGGEDRAPWVMDATVMQLILPPSLKCLAP